MASAAGGVSGERLLRAFVAGVDGAVTLGLLDELGDAASLCRI